MVLAPRTDPDGVSCGAWGRVDVLASFGVSCGEDASVSSIDAQSIATTNVGADTTLSPAISDGVVDRKHSQQAEDVLETTGRSSIDAGSLDPCTLVSKEQAEALARTALLDARLCWTENAERCAEAVEPYGPTSIIQRGLTVSGCQPASAPCGDVRCLHPERSA